MFTPAGAFAKLTRLQPVILGFNLRAAVLSDMWFAVRVTGARGTSKGGTPGGEGVVVMVVAPPVRIPPSCPPRHSGSTPSPPTPPPPATVCGSVGPPVYLSKHVLQCG